MRDRHSLYAAFVRSVATGMIGVLLGVYLAEPDLEVAILIALLSAGGAALVLEQAVLPASLLREGLVRWTFRRGSRMSSGITHLIRLSSWAVAPTIARLLMSGTSLVLPLYIGAARKLLYDLLLWRAIRKVRPPEESACPPVAASK